MTIKKYTLNIPGGYVWYSISMDQVYIYQIGDEASSSFPNMIYLGEL